MLLLKGDVIINIISILNKMIVTSRSIAEKKNVIPIFTVHPENINTSINLYSLVQLSFHVHFIFYLYYLLLTTSNSMKMSMITPI